MNVECDINYFSFFALLFTSLIFTDEKVIRGAFLATQQPCKISFT